MNAPLYPEVLLRSNDDRQHLLPLTTDGVARWVWESRFGSMLIEVVGDSVYVNGAKVARHDMDHGGNRFSGLASQIGPAVGSQPLAPGTHSAEWQVGSCSRWG